MGCKGDKQSVCQGGGDGGQEDLGGNRDHVGPGGWGWGGIFIVGKGRGHVFDILQRGKCLDCVQVRRCTLCNPGQNRTQDLGGWGGRWPPATRAMY